MNSRIVLFSLISTFLLFALVVAASAQTRTVGVSVGNAFRYSVTVSWSSTDPNATPPSDLTEVNNTQSEEVNVTAISGTNVTAQITAYFKNGTETTLGGWLDVNTGNNKNITIFFISANLTVGDSMYNSSSANTYIINETVPRTYSGVERDTNHLNVPPSSPGTQNYSTDVYWDKSTGVLVEFLQETTNQTGTYTTTESAHAQIISSDLWTVPEYPTWTSTLLILIAIAPATIVIVRQKRAHQ
ncbi:MAG: hypothetical protein ABSC91_04945 [Candidatus Bathyarchaeia archaeon]|jgi:hypothetical protein